MGLATQTVDNVVDTEKEVMEKQIETCETGKIDLAEVFIGNKTRYCRFVGCPCKHDGGNAQTAIGYIRYCTRAYR